MAASLKVNKIPYDFASLRLTIDADDEPLGLINAFTELNYSDNVDREKLRGADRVALAATEGEYDAEGSITFHRYGYNAINTWAKANGKGIYSLVMTLSVSYAHKNEPLVTDTITGVRIGSRENSHSQGPDPLVVPCDLFIEDRIFFDGLGPFGEVLG